MAPPKLTDSLREEIRQAYIPGSSTHGLQPLAERYQVSVALIHRVTSGKRYKGKQANNNKCLFCTASLTHKRGDARFCNPDCKVNYRRLGPQKTPVGKKRRFPAVPKSVWIGKTYGTLTILDSPDLPNQWRAQSNIKIPVHCACGRETRPWMYSLSRGETVLCGYCSPRMSTPALELLDYLQSLFPEAQGSVRGVLHNDPLMELDIWVPSRRLAVEYHGLFWHCVASNPKANRNRDYRKYLSCQAQGIRLIQVYSDDWELRKPIFEDLFQRIADPAHSQRVYKLKAREIDGKTAAVFLRGNHYLSGSQVCGTLYIGLFAKRTLRGVSIFKKRSNRECEWVRHAFQGGYRAWNPAGRALELARQELQFNKLVSFSDNRVHTGATYAALGFIPTPLRQNYEYTNGRIRRHKFAFRVPAGVDEIEQAASQGWYRIYDSGKTRWVLET